MSTPLHQERVLAMRKVSPLGEHCDGCGEWLGTPFVRAEESHRPVHGAKSRLQLQAS